MRHLLVMAFVLMAFIARSQQHKGVDTVPPIKLPKNWTFSVIPDSLLQGIVMTRADLIIQYDCFGGDIFIDFINGKPVAKKPYSVKLFRKNLIIFKNGKKIGAIGYYKLTPQLKNLQLN